MQQGLRLVRHPERTQGRESAAFEGVKLRGIATQGDEAPLPFPLSTELQQPHGAAGGGGWAAGEHRAEHLLQMEAWVLKIGSALCAVIPAADRKGL